MQEYVTVVEDSYGEYEEKRSRFIAVMAHAETPQQAADFVAAVRSKHFDARHNVYAYALRDGTVRFSDDGEPHGTAGKPVLEVLAGSGTVDAVIVVTRYFGGVLLGTGGLVRAYTAAAKAAVESSQPVVMCKIVSGEVKSGYSELEMLKDLITKKGGVIADIEYTDAVTVRFDIRTEDADAFENALREVFSARLTLSRSEEKFAPFKKN